MTSIRLTLALCAGLACSAFALTEPDPTKPADSKSAATSQPPQGGQPIPVAVPPAPPAATPIPVPDLPIVQKSEVEGIVIEDMKIGTGYEVKPAGVVVAHYHGTLKTDGSVFDSSFERGEPIAFPLTGVIQGWGKGVPGMKVGGIRKLTIPAALGYGERGMGAKIPPNSDLVFIIELVDALQIEDIKEGTGEEVRGQSVAVTTFKMFNEKGEVIDSADAAKPYIWIPGEFQPITFGLEGMKTGGKRKLTIPKQMNVSPPQANSTRPQNVPCTMEVELVAVRNLTGRR